MRWDDTEIEKAVGRREAMMRMVGCIIRMLRRDIIHSYKSEKPQQSVSLLSLGKSQSGYGMHDKYQYSSRINT